MLNTVKINNLIDDRVRRLFTKFNKLERQIEEQNLDFVECEICGCLLKKENADPGEKVIKRPCRIRHPYDDDYIYQTYYCKIHSPRKEEEKVFIDNDKPVKIVLAADASMPFPSNYCHKACPTTENPYMEPVFNDLQEITHLRCAACKATIKL